ncbi:sigma-70 family RNA polymerase sigma factor [Pseudonocardia nigra]|uniref:sigma-70 family RNA polymerase sigma factor n=1 Tax=Pseudonocardia nigra TaxID=1921578 RepID=UPI00355850BE
MPPTTAPPGPPVPRQRPHSPVESPAPSDHPAATAPPDRRADAADVAAGPDDAVTAGAHAGEAADHPDETGAWALVKASQAGDMVAFGELFDRYYDVVYRYVLFRMGDRTLAEDVTQETFVRALRRITSVSYQGRDIGAWFVTIARNLIFDHVKSSRYRLEQTTSEIVELSPSTGGPEQQVLDGATNDELLRCVRKLNPDQQECIQLRFLQGLSVAETARIMDRNEGAVKALQHRAVRRLAQLLPEGLR